MKKISLVLFTCLYLSNFLLAQEFPGYGVVSNDEINLKQVSFDADADAVVLLHEAFSGYDDRRQLITTHHIKIKILREKGIASANIAINFYRKDDFELVDQVEGMTINAGAGTTTDYIPLERKSIFTKPINERVGEVIFAFPSIKVGSIIDYKYRSTMKTYGGLRDWDFQEELPVIKSKYTLVIVPNLEFAYSISKAPDIPIIIKKENFEGGVYFEMNNIPGLGEEPYMDARRDYVQKVVFQLSGYNRYGSRSNYMTSWDEVTRELTSSSEFGGQLNKNISGTDDFINQTKALASPEEKMKQVFNYVRNNMNWNGLYSIYMQYGVKDAWQKKGGSSGDVNLLLINLLKQVSLDAYPVLVSERFHGKVNVAYPFIDQFNSVFACVVINNKKYFLDATNRSTPPHLTPFDILNTTAFIVNRKAGGIINITNDTTQYQEDIIVDLALANDGTLSGDASVKSKDYARIKKLADYRADKSKFLERYFIVDGTSIAGKELEVSDIDNDSLPFGQYCKISGSLNTSGEYSFLPLNIFTGFVNNPFLSDNRFSNINFGYRRQITLHENIQLADGYVVDDVPKSVKLSNPEKDIIFLRQLEYNKQDNSIRCTIQFQFKKSLYETENYPIIKQVYEKIFEYLKEPVVLKRK